MAEKIEHGIGAWKEKPWGHTRTIYRDDCIEIVECKIKKGGYSSVHSHSRKHNEFQVISGALIVRRSANDDGWRVGRGSDCIFFAGDYHQFEAVEDTRLLEIYTSADGSPIDPDDIERFTAGGLRR